MRFLVTLFSLVLYSGGVSADPSSPCMRALLNNESKPVSDTVQVLNRILGHVDIEANARGRLTATFSADLEQAARKKAGTGGDLIELLENHINLNSPTAVRIE